MGWALSNACSTAPSNIINLNISISKQNKAGKEVLDDLFTFLYEKGVNYTRVIDNNNPSDTDITITYSNKNTPSKVVYQGSNLSNNDFSSLYAKFSQ